MNESIKEVTSAIKDIFINPVKEAVIFRAKNNFFGSLFISWIAWNWEKIAFLFISNMYIADRIDFIKNHFPSPSEDHWWIFPYSNSLIWPVIIATLFTLTYPFFMYVLSVTHKSILTKIDDFNLTNEQESLIRKKDVITEAENLETHRLQIRAKANRIIEEDNERTIRAQKNIQEINATYFELNESVKKLTQEKNGLELTIENQASRMQVATEELAKINERLGPESEREKIMNSFQKRIIEQDARVKDLMITNESLAYDNKLLKESLSSKVEQIEQSQSNLDRIEYRVYEAKRNIKQLITLSDLSQFTPPPSFVFEYSNLKKALIDFSDDDWLGKIKENEKKSD